MTRPLVVVGTPCFGGVVTQGYTMSLVQLTTAALQIDAARWRRLRRLMWECMGPVRSGAGQRAALARLRSLLTGAPACEVSLRLRLRLCVAMVQAALAREESRGAHWRSDFPVRDRRRDGWRALAEPGPRPGA